MLNAWLQLPMHKLGCVRIGAFKKRQGRVALVGWVDKILSSGSGLAAIVGNYYGPGNPYWRVP